MRIFSFFVVALALVGCGKLSNKYGRLDDQFTRVYLAGPKDLTTTMNGGVMVYFARVGGPGGRAFGFSSVEIANGAAVVVPNGDYFVYVMGTEDGSNNILEGQAKCGRGNGGQVVHLSGGTSTVDVLLNVGQCQFGSPTPFGDSLSANAANDNFDQLNFVFCSGAAPSCSAITSSAYRVKFRMMGGEKPGGGGEFAPAEPLSLTSNCSATMSSGTITSSVRFFGSSIFSPPVELLIYADAACASATVAHFHFPEGLNSYRNPATSSTVYLESPATSNITYLKIKYP